MKKIFIILLFLIVYCASKIEDCESQPAWIEQQTGYSINHSVECVHFFNAQTGILGGGFGTFARTTNGGINWIHINNNENNHYESIFFINSNIGWISGGFYNSSFTIELVRKTTNGGITWDSAYFDSDARVWDIQFINETTGFMAGKYLKKTINGGLNWFVIDNTNDVFINHSIFFINTMTGWASKYYGDIYSGISVSKILKTSDGGQNWITQIIDSSNSNNSFNDIQFLNENTGYVAKTTLGVMKTINGGQNWFAVFSNSSGYKLFFINENTGWVGIWNYILKTTNAGANWLSEFLYQGCYFRGMFFMNELTGWTSGMTNISQPKLYKTTNGGTSAIIKYSENVPSNYSLSQNYPNPFNPTTKIRFEIPNDLSFLRKQESSKVSLVVYDILGKEITTLVNEQLKPGTYEVTFDGSNLSSGIYFYQLNAGDYTKTMKMLMIK